MTPETGVVRLIVVSTVVRLALACVVPPLGDEAYYWHLGTQFQPSYFDHPPLTYWMAALGHRLAPLGGFGAVRLPFVLLFSGSTWLMFLIGRQLFGGRAGFHAALLLHLSIVLPVTAGVFAVPESPLFFFWLACVWALSRLFFDPARRQLGMWLALGVLLGLSFLAKYHAVFIPVGAALVVLTQPGLRRFAWHWGPYLALAVAVVVSSLVILWNAQHDWISFSYQLARGTRIRELQPAAVLKSLAGQALFLMPWIWFPLIRELVRSLGKGPGSPATWFLSLMAVGPIALFTVLTVVNRQWYLFHWPAVGYLSLFPALGATVSGVAGSAAWVRPRLALSTATVAMCGLLLLYGSLFTPGTTSLLPLSRAPSVAIARNYDLSGYAGLHEALVARGLLDDPNLFVFTNHYMDSGRVAWSVRGARPVRCFALQDGAKGYPFLKDASGWPGANGLAISRSDDAASDLAMFRPYFARVTVLGSVSVGNGINRVVLHLHRFEGMIRPFVFAYGPQPRAWQNDVR